ncbi:MAG TPA: UDP-N-acetylmuramoyl-tripeptide--D-alanyl-D-alanine ligase [Usitatibacter sp.]|nr:UDP-N-acetylmuramoyl-tripeptide--D-alanyl-D-alanine ligase [Usitatibacter sp.]
MNGVARVGAPPMMDLKDVALAVGGALHGDPVAFSGVTTDSRRVTAGDLFVALAGERFDGNQFVDEAAGRGAVAALTSRLVEAGMPLPQVVVADTRSALGRLAAHWRNRFALPVVALTGSNGKTTVKEMLASILAAHCGGRDAVLATEGNLNNDIGVPLTLFRLRHSHRYAVIEMGMNHAGEIDYLTHIARPAVALVTNAHRAHVGILGSVDAIARAKGEIYGGLGPQGIAVVNEDDAFASLWKDLNKGTRIVTFGLSEAADVRATFEGREVRIVTPGDAFAVILQVAGEHNVRNALAACAVAHALEIPPRAMQAGLAAFAGVPGRLQRRPMRDGGFVIDDTYNANPESMKAAIRVLAAQAGRRIFVMGDMGELGAGARELHAEVGDFARANGIEALLALGPDSASAAEAFGTGARHFDSVEKLLEAARAEAGAGATVLVKGSRFMKMERVADALAQATATARGGHDAA